MKLPSVRSLTIALSTYKAMAKAMDTDKKQASIEVRLQVLENSEWKIHSGQIEYDDCHEGWFGFASVESDSDLRVVAEGLLNEIKDHLYVHNHK